MRVQIIKRKIKCPGIIKGFYYGAPYVGFSIAKNWFRTDFLNHGFWIRINPLSVGRW